MRLSGYVYEVRFYSFTFEPKTIPALTWVQHANGNYEAVDRGQNADIYTTRLTFVGEVDAIDSLVVEFDTIAQYDTNKYVTLDEFNGVDDQIFGANINYSSSLKAIITNIGKRRQKSKNVYHFDVEMQLVPTYTYTGTSLQPSEYYLLSNHIGTVENYDQFQVSNTLAYNFYRSQLNAGTFEGTFMMSAIDTKNFRYAIFNSIRGATMTIWDTMGIGRLFGVLGNNFPVGIKILEYSDRQIDIDFWEIRVIFAEVK